MRPCGHMEALALLAGGCVFLVGSQGGTHPFFCLHPLTMGIDRFAKEGEIICLRVWMETLSVFEEDNKEVAASSRGVSWKSTAFPRLY